MTDAPLRREPAIADVVREQVRTVGLSLRAPMMAAAALLAVVTVVVAHAVVREGDVIGFHPERWILPAALGLLLPVAVWSGTERFGAGFLWTLPVDRARHAAVRVFAGWVWLMAGVAVLVAWLLAASLLSGTHPLAPETLRMVPALPHPGPGPVDPSIVREVRWTPEPVLWLAPFTAATATYLLASALALGARHPLRWIIGGVLAFVLIVAASEAGNVELAAAPARMLEQVLTGRYGLSAVAIADTEALKVETTLPDGRPVVVWRGLPDVASWATATLLWTCAGLLALWAAARRHRETRRP